MMATETTNGRAAVETRPGVVVLVAPYDADLIAAVKALQGRRYLPDVKAWEIGHAWATERVALIERFGFARVDTMQDAIAIRDTFLAAQSAAAKADDVAVQTTVTHGIFAVEVQGARTILRVGDGFKDDDGTSIVSVGYGGEYEGFGHVNADGSFHVWRKAQGRTREIEAARILFGASTAEVEAMGRAYALESGRCWRCGRTLTDERSIAAGIGPDCAAQIGAER